MTPDPTSDQGRWTAAVRDFIAWIDERAPSDFDIEAGTAEAHWWQELKKAFFRVEDIGRAAVRDAAEVPVLRARLEAAEAVIRRYDAGWRQMSVNSPPRKWARGGGLTSIHLAMEAMAPAEVEAIARARGDQPDTGAEP